MRCNLQNLTNKSMAEICGNMAKICGNMADTCGLEICNISDYRTSHKHFSLTRLSLKPNPPQKLENKFLSQ